MTVGDGPLPQLSDPVEPGQDDGQPYDGLEPLELRMVKAAISDEVLEPGADPADQPATIRARTLARLLADESWKVAAKAVRLRGVRITGQLDLREAKLRCPLNLENCYFDGGEPLNLDFATVPMLSLIGC